MQYTSPVQSLSDEALLRSLAELAHRSRRVEAELVAHIGEVDERRLYAREACSSMFAYATEILHLSEAEAYLRIAAARAARKFPTLLSRLADGRLHLSAVALLAPHLTEENCDRVLSQAEHRSKRQVEEIVAGLAPKPDAPAVIRRVPVSPAPDVVVELRPERVELPNSQTPSSAPPARPAPPSKVEPLSPERYKVSFTANAQLRVKLGRLQELMNEDLATVIEAAVTEKLERLEAKRIGAAKRPRKTLDESGLAPSSRYIPAPVKRVVWRRDCGQCTFLDKNGRRCTERRRLEFHHDDPFGRGGDHDPSNLRVLCRTHNLLLAERDYGRDVVKRHRTNRGRVSETGPVYGFIEPLRPLFGPTTGHAGRRGAAEHDDVGSLLQGTNRRHMVESK